MSSTEIAAFWSRALVLAAGFWLLPSVGAAKQFNACRASTNAVYHSCTAGTQSDKALAVGKCANLPDSGAMMACREQAGADGRDALKTCAEQRKFRSAVCTRLGPAPYSPAID